MPTTTTARARRRRLASIRVLLPLMTAARLAAGQGSAARMPPERRWMLSGVIGRGWGHSFQAVEQAMIEAGLDDPLACSICDGPLLFPFTDRGGVSSAVALTYLVTPTFGFRAQKTAVKIGETSGFRAGATIPDFGTGLVLSQKVTSVALLAGITSGGVVGLWAGPALHFAQVFPVDTRAHAVTRLGGVVRVALTLPPRSRLCFEAAWQYAWVPPVTTGPYHLVNGIDSTVTDVPPFRVPLSHSLGTAGLGIRF